MTVVAEGAGGGVTADRHDPEVLRMHGEIDLNVVHAGGPQLLAALGRARRLEVDTMTFVDSMGLRCLVVAATAARARGRTLQLVGASDSIRRLLETTGVASLLKVDPPEGQRQH